MYPMILYKFHCWQHNDIHVRTTPQYLQKPLQLLTNALLDKVPPASRWWKKSTEKGGYDMVVFSTSLLMVEKFHHIGGDFGPPL